MHTTEILLSKRPFDIRFASTFHVSRILPRTYYSSGYTSGRIRLPMLLIQIFMAISSEKKNAAKSRWRKIAKRLDDQRSVLKSLLNLSLPSKTGHIYRQYRDGERPTAGRLQNRTVGTDVLRLFLAQKQSDSVDRSRQESLSFAIFSVTR